MALAKAPARHVDELKRVILAEQLLVAQYVDL